MIKEKTFYTATNEAVFYYCIGNNLNKAKTFIQQVIKRPIYEIEIKNAKLLKDYMYTKEKTLDYLVLTDIGYINIEINNYNKDWGIKRDVAYACKVVGNSVEKAKDYGKMEKVIQININKMGKTSKGVVSYKLNADEECEVFPNTLTDVIEIYMVNIDFYKDMVYNGNKKFIKDNYLLCAMDLKPNDIDKISEGNEELMEFKEMLEKINDNEDFVKWIDAEKEAEIFHNTMINESKETGLKQGIEEGREQGLLQGIEQGIQKGERNKQIAIVQNLLNEGSSVEFIAKVTGLSIEEINDLK